MSDKKLEVPRGIGLPDFLKQKLQASTLSVRVLSPKEILLESDSIVQVHIFLNEEEKKISFDLYSTRWSRRISVQLLKGFEFMEPKAEEQLLKENAAAVAEDTLLALDLLRIWGRKNGYETHEVAPGL